MAPTQNPNPNVAEGASNKKPTVLSTVAKAKRVLPKYSHSQRSSLRLAIQESLRESIAIAENTNLRNPTASPTASPSLLSTPSTSPTLPSKSNFIPQRRSKRPAPRRNLHVNTASAAEVTRQATRPSTPSLSSNSTPTTPSTAASSMPRTPVTPYFTPSSTATSASPPSASSLSTSRFSTPSKSSKNQSLHAADSRHVDSEDSSDEADDDDSDSDYVENVTHTQYARVDDTDRPNVNGIVTPFKGWYRIRSIVTEMRNRSGGLIYLVDWEGTDPRTGISWPSSWVDAKNVSVAAIRAWETQKLRTSTMNA
ncbi:hypothetical protein F5B19DRAFT_472311 [Rostrohypoxylon terebratum]|nr:hypothetical protein F5B19DRAFT_472311 [Rostrohypoxylon terebratum]